MSRFIKSSHCACYSSHNMTCEHRGMCILQKPYTKSFLFLKNLNIAISFVHMYCIVVCAWFRGDQADFWGLATKIVNLETQHCFFFFGLKQDKIGKAQCCMLLGGDQRY